MKTIEEMKGEFVAQFGKEDGTVSGSTKLDDALYFLESRLREVAKYFVGTKETYWTKHHSEDPKHGSYDQFCEEQGYNQRIREEKQLYEIIDDSNSSTDN